MTKLRQYAISKHGLIDTSIRKVAWPALLNISDNDGGYRLPDEEWKSAECSQAGQIKLDTDRSLNNVRFFREKSQAALGQVINAVFHKNPMWTYTQGYNDWASIFFQTISK